MPFFQYIILPGVHTIEIFVPKYKQIIELTYSEGGEKTSFLSKTTLQNLKMGTDYHICLGITDICGNQNDNSQCTTHTTLEGFPSEPTVVKLENYYDSRATEKNLQLTWTAPTDSGKILNYIINIESTCPQASDLFCKQNTSTETILHNQTKSDELQYVFKGKAFCTYVASVAAVNSKGEGALKRSNEVQTSPEVKLPERIDIVPDVFNLTVNIYPGCPFTGPIEYKIQVENQRHIPAQKLSYKGKVGNVSKLIQNLLMGTEYNVCVCVDECRNSKFQKCQRKKTLEAPPFSPTNVKIVPHRSRESNYLLTWSAPENSGHITGYNFTVNIACPEKSVTACIQEKKNFQGSQTKLSYQFEANPFCLIEASVVAQNSEGPGAIAATTFKTPWKAQLPQNVTLIPSPFNITVNVYPGCPFTGPFDYTVTILDHVTRVLQHDGNKAWLTATFDNLTPAKNYTACISAPGLNAKCYQTTTVQIPPKDSPKITGWNSTQNVLNIQVQKPEKSYQMEKELLVYNFFIQSDCIQVDNKCNNTNCGLNYTEVRKSQVETFTLKLSGLDPYMSYQIKSMAQNQAGAGPLSDWSQWYPTMPASDETFRKITADFSPSSSNDAIHLDLHPVCPYKGIHYYSLTHIIV